MPIVSATTAKTYFETSAKPTEAEFTDLIDSAIRSPVVAVATAAEGGAVGVVHIRSSVSASLEATGAVGLQLLSTATTAAAIAILPVLSAVTASGAWTFVTAAVIGASAATFDNNNVFTNGSFNLYRITLNNLRLVNNGSVLLRLSFDGSTYLTTSVQSYHYNKESELATTYVAIAGTGAGYIAICDTSGNAGGQSINATIYVYQPGQTSRKSLTWQYLATRASAGIFEGGGGGYIDNNAAATGIRILPSTGEFGATGTVVIHSLFAGNPL